MIKWVAAIAVLVVLLVLVLLKAPANSTPPTQTSNASAFRVALVTPGRINDGGWSENAYKGAKRIEQELNAQLASTVAGSPNEAFSAFRDYAQQGHDLIIGHASEWFDPKTLEISNANPRSTFLISASENAEGNVCGVRFLLEDGCYILGQLAASMSKTKVLGCIGPKPLPVIESTFYAFEQGAKSVDPNIVVKVLWTDAWEDVARAKEQALILMSQNADFLFHNANDCAPGVFQAVQEKRKAGADVYALGSNADQNALADDVILASAVLDIPAVFLDLGRKIQRGQFDRKAQAFGLPEGVVWIAYNPKLEKRIPADVRKRLDETTAAIRSRSLTVPRRQLTTK